MKLWRCPRAAEHAGPGARVVVVGAGGAGPLLGGSGGGGGGDGGRGGGGGRLGISVRRGDTAAARGRGMVEGGAAT